MASELESVKSVLDVFWRQLKSTPHLLIYGLRSRWPTLLLTAFAAMVAWMWIQPFSENPESDVWNNLQPVVGIATLLVAIGVWIGELRQDWNRQLPRRLNVYFMANKKPLLVCKNALLPGEHDIRNLGQQILSQMSRIRLLDFDAARIQAKELPNVVLIDGAYKPFQLVIHYLSEEKNSEEKNSEPRDAESKQPESDESKISAKEKEKTLEDLIAEYDGKCLFGDVKPDKPTEFKLRDNSHADVQPVQ